MRYLMTFIVNLIILSTYLLIWDRKCLTSKLLQKSLDFFRNRLQLKVTIIKESKDIDKLKFDEPVCILQTYEVNYFKNVEVDTKFDSDSEIDLDMIKNFIKKYKKHYDKKISK